VNYDAQRILAFDFGLRQIGVAVGNTRLGTTQALRILPAKEGAPNWDEVSSLAREWQPDLLLVGDPLNMDGSESELARRARKFAKRLHGRLGLPVQMVDERLSSFEAKRTSREQGHKGNYKARPIDSLAAEIILRSWLAEG
jgi:putative Holliday junction resolvase